MGLEGLVSRHCERAYRGRRMRIKQSLLFSCVLMAASGVAAAQAPPVPATPPAQTAPPSPARAANCAPMQQAPYSGTAAPERTTTGQRTEPLGDKLARSDGVLCPPAGVDPDMRAPAPDIGNTPVIPPPRQPRRRPHGPAEITPTAANTLSCAELLESCRSAPSARQPWSMLQMVVEHDPEHDHRAGRYLPALEHSDNARPPAKISLPMR